MRYVAGLIALGLVLAAARPQAFAAREGQKRDTRRREQDKKRRSQAAKSPPRPRVAFSDEAVRRSIEKGCRYLWSLRRKDGSWPPYKQKEYPAGPTALAAYALLASGVSPLDRRMAKTLDWLGKQETVRTYTLGLRCNAWHLANQRSGGKYVGQLRKDVRRLVVYTERGSYKYDCEVKASGRTDNSNAQYGVLGTWAGAMARLEIPAQYWRLVMEHWKNDQKSDGGWPYRPNEQPSCTMTVGGIATLYVCFDNLFADRFVRCNVTSEYRPIQEGLKWMDRHFRESLAGKHMGHGDLYYFLYGVERVGLASGYKYFGTDDWYRLGAAKVLAAQRDNGSWNAKRGEVVATAFAILFLVRGQHAVAFNKLEFKGDWNNRPRDLAGLTRWMTGAFERTLNWQIINLKVPVEQWHDAPILYISGSVEPQFTEQHLEKLRRYVWQGGTIFSVTECGGRGFRDGIRKVYGKLFPTYELVKLPPDHELYGIHKDLRGRPEFHQVTNGIRPLAIHCDEDLSRSWQLELRRTGTPAFDAAGNVLMYVTDKGQLRNRGVTVWPPAPRGSPGDRIKLARLRHDGNWDPEPLAFERFRRLLARQAKVDLDVTAVPIEDLPRSAAKVATMTGTERFSLRSGEKAALKRFVEDGGTLVIDAGGGSRAFAESAEVMLTEIFGRTAVRRLASTAPVYQLPGMKIDRVQYRRKARVRLGGLSTPNLRVVRVKERSAVYFSKEDLTGGLVGYPSYSCVGYQPESCFQIMRNLVIHGHRTGAK